MPGVSRIEGVQARWLGHAICAELAIGLDPEVDVAEAAGIADAVRRHLLEAQPLMGDAIVRPVPSGH